MPAFFHGRWGHYPFLLGACLLLFFANLGGASLWDVDEGRNATAALEMMESGNYIVPTYNALLRVDKPALLYWLQIVGYRTFGVNEWGARFPSALAALLTVLLAYELGRRLFQPSTGFLGALIVAGAPMMCGAARFANPDALLHLFTVLYLTIFWFGHQRLTWSWFLGLGAAAGLAVLAKGPVGLVLPTAVAVSFLVWEKRWHTLGQCGWVLAALTFSLVALPWYILVGVETKASFLRGFIMNHNVDRFLSPMENHRGFPGFYVIVLFLGLLPWSAFLGLGVWFGVWSLVRQPRPRWAFVWERAADRSQADSILHDATVADPAARYRFLWTWIGVYVVFFSLAATKLPNYVLPALAPTALILARFLDRWRLGQLHLANRWIYAGLGGVMVMGLLIGLGLAVAGGAIPWPRLKGPVFSGLELWAVIGLVPIVAGASAWRMLRRQHKTGTIACLAAGALLLMVPLTAWAATIFNRFKAPAPLVAQAGACQRNEDIRIGCWQVGHLASLNFYVQRDVTHFAKIWQPVLFLESHLPVYLFIPAPLWEDMKTQVRVPWRELARGRDLYRNVEVLVISNR